ncbi:5548_t:CDS:2 [Funneliformis caledonium]|uniref:5548_t:CDS:1 n=1 Tax=Funneliformis caledonium TaxID=1117310 RepID=A0A9N9CI66_9GLOM|nr:5548_t:CDS:2 [Funneliformis caledonium]
MAISLPMEVMEIIFNLQNIHTLHNLILVNRQWSSIAIQSLWNDSFSKILSNYEGDKLLIKTLLVCDNLIPLIEEIKINKQIINDGTYNSCDLLSKMWTNCAVINARKSKFLDHPFFCTEFDKESANDFENFHNEYTLLLVETKKYLSNYTNMTDEFGFDNIRLPKWTCMDSELRTEHFYNIGFDNLLECVKIWVKKQDVIYVLQNNDGFKALAKHDFYLVSAILRRVLVTDYDKVTLKSEYISKWNAHGIDLSKEF